MKRPKPGITYALTVHTDKPAPLWHRRLASYLTALENGHEGEGEREVAREDLPAETQEWYKLHTLKQYGRSYTGISRDVESPGWFRCEGMYWREGQEEEAREAQRASLHAQAEKEYRDNLAQSPDYARERRDRLVALAEGEFYTFPAEMGMEMAFDEEPSESLWLMIEARIRAFLLQEDITPEVIRLVCTQVTETTLREWLP